MANNLMPVAYRNCKNMNFFRKLFAPKPNTTTPQVHTDIAAEQAAFLWAPASS